MDAPRPGWPMWKRIAVRVALVPVIFVVVSAGTFWLLFGAADDIPARQIAGDGATDAQVQTVTESLGLDEPVAKQYARWLRSAGQGDLGRSWVSGETITAEVLDRVAPTIEIATIALLVAFTAGIGLAALARGAQRIREESALGTAALISALPIALTLVLIVIVPSRYWDYSYPLGGYVSPLDDLEQNLRLLGPASVTVGLALSAFVLLVLRKPGFASPVDPRALAEATYVSVPLILVGVVITDRIFSINGLGYMLFSAAFVVDLPTMQALVTLFLTLGIACVMFARLWSKPPTVPAALKTPGWGRIRGSPILLAGVGIVTIAVVAAVIGPELRSGGRELNMDLQYAGPSLAHPFGANAYGQDLLDQVLSATRRGLMFAGAVVVTSYVPAAVIGAVAVHFSRRAVAALDSVAAYLVALPAMVILLALLTGGFFQEAFRSQLRIEVVSAGVLALAIGLRAGSRISIERQDPWRTARLALPVVVEGTCWIVAAALLFQASVRFLFDFDSIQLKWTFGGLINEGSRYAFAYWHLLLAPGLALTLIVFGFLLIAVRLAAWRQDAEAAALDGGANSPQPLTGDG
jgi:peptide/nickel transport system permease protein